MTTSRWPRQYAARRTARTPNSPATKSAARNKANTDHCCQPSLLIVQRQKAKVKRQKLGRAPRQERLLNFVLCVSHQPTAFSLLPFTFLLLPFSHSGTSATRKPARDHSSSPST